MPMNESQRKAVVDLLAVNCSCWSKPEDRETLNKMSEEQLTSLIRAQFSVPSGSNNLSVTAPPPVAQPVIQNAQLSPEVSAQITALTQTVTALNATVQSLAEQQKAAQDSVKKSLIEGLVSNVEESQRETLRTVYNTMTPEQLSILHAHRPALTNPLLPIYMSGGVTNTGSASGSGDDDPLEIPTINYEEDSDFAQAQRRKQGAA